MRSPSHVFISFKTDDKDIAYQLRNALVESGLNVWWQEDIQCGQEWHGEIDKAIEDAGAIIVLWSKQSMLSEWVKHEASQAISKKIYTPVRIEVMEIDPPFNRIQATDLFNWKNNVNDPGFVNLLHRLKVLMPEPITISEKISQFIRKQRIAIFFCLLAISAFYLLFQLNNSQKRVLANMARNLYPFDANKLAIGYSVRWNSTNPYIREYAHNLLHIVYEQLSISKIDSLYRSDMSFSKEEDYSLQYSFEHMKVLFNHNKQNKLEVVSITLEDTSKFMPHCDNKYERIVLNTFAQMNLCYFYQKINHHIKIR